MTPLRAPITVTETDRFQAIVTDPSIYNLGDVLMRDPGGPGRPHEFPGYVYAIYVALVGAVGSGRRAAAILRSPLHWELVREGVARCLGEEEAARLPAEGPRRGQCRYAAQKLTAHLDELQDRAQRAAAALARSRGHFDGTGNSMTEPERRDFIVADGTVVKAAIRGRKKGQGRPERRDDGAGWHHEGGDNHDEPVYGVKMIFISTRRSSAQHDRIILSVTYQPPGGGYGGEAGLSVDAIEGLRERLPGIRGLCYDGALRGVHHDRLMKAGLLSVSPQHGSIRPQPLKPVTDCGCGERHDLFTYKGQLSERLILDTGKTFYQKLRHVKLERRGRGVSHRWYHVVELTCGLRHRERIDTTPEDRRRTFNRAEHLRQFPPDSESFKRTYGFRADAESLNATLDSTLWNRRMPAYSRPAQALVMLGFMLAQNALTRWRDQRVR